jgi:hypothetical protein
VKKLTEGRIEAIAVAAAEALAATPDVDVRDRGDTVRRIAGRLREGFGASASLDKAVRARIASLSRRVPEGSREWDVLYRQYAEELAKRKS